MARTKRRQYGSGCLLNRGRGWAIRWRELEIAADGTTRRALRYEALGSISRGEAGELLAQRVAAAGNSKAPTRSRVTFQTLAAQWEAHVLPMYKQSTQKNHRHIVKKHLLPQFGDKAVAEVTRQEVQAYVAYLAQAGYAPKTIDHIHDVLSAVLRTAVGLRGNVRHAEDRSGRSTDSIVGRRDAGDRELERPRERHDVRRQVIDGALRMAVDKVGSELFTIVHNPENGGALNR